MSIQPGLGILESFSIVFGRKPHRSRRRSFSSVAADVRQTEILETRALLAFDFGDAPDPTLGTSVQDYQTSLTSDGPRHQLDGSQTTLFLGAGVDADTGTDQSLTASLDDQFAADGRDDEDGVLSPIDLSGTVGAEPRITLSATNTTGKVATLYGWMDFNHNGNFENATERASIVIPSNSIAARFTLIFPTAPTGSAGTTYARFRLSTDVAAANSIGEAADGEVEDYPFVINRRGQLTAGVDQFIQIDNAFDTERPSTVASSFGDAVASIGDLDGDGIGDLAVGAPQDTAAGHLGSGAVYVLFMKSDRTVRTSVKIAAGLNGGPDMMEYERFGYSLAAIGDIDGDGITDLAVGTGLSVWIVNLHADGTAKYSSRIASGVNGGPTFEIGDLFGRAVAAIGDLNGDGTSDIVVGAPYTMQDGRNRGAAYVLFLNAAGTAAGWTRVSADAAGSALGQVDFLGTSLAAIGDLDGDGVPEIAITGYGNLLAGTDSAGAGGTIQIVSLQSNGTVKWARTLASELAARAKSNRLGGAGSVTSAGDLDADGVKDLAYGSYSEGTVQLILLNSDGTVKGVRRLEDPRRAASSHPGAFSTFGTAMSFVGDVNGDGIPELVVGAPDGPGYFRGDSVFLVSLAAPELPSKPTLDAIPAKTTKQRPQFHWASDPLATSYELWFRNRSTGAIQTKIVLQPQYAFTEDVGIGQFSIGVRSVNDTGKSPWSATSNFIINSAVIVNATDDGMDTRPALSWQPLAGAVKYDIWLNDIRTPSAPLVNIRSGSAETTFVPGVRLADGSYRFQVRGVAADGTVGQWSIVDEFTVTTTTTIRQVSNQFTFRPRIEWNYVPGAASYEIWVSALPSNKVRIQTRVDARFFISFAPDADLLSGNYRAWVRPVAADGSMGQWSSFANFSAGIIPTVVTDQTEYTTNEWMAYSIPEMHGVTYVDYWVDDPAPGLAPATSGVHRESFRKTSDQVYEPQGKYRVWVRYAAADGSTSRWSAPVSFTVKGRPAIVWTVNQTGKTDLPKIEWYGVAGASHYEIQIRNTATSTSLSLVTTDATTRLNLTEPLPLGTYVVDVRPISLDGTEGYWTSSGPYTSLPKLTLVPISSTIDSTPEFRWDSISGANSYDVVVRNVTTRSVQFTVRGLTAASYISPTLPLGPYELWVIANAPNGLRSAWASAAFTVVAPPKPVLNVHGPGYSYGYTEFLIDWTSVAGADHYDLWIADSHGVLAVRELNVSRTSYILTTIIPRENYRIWVRAVYADGSNSPWSRPEWFVVY